MGSEKAMMMRDTDEAGDMDAGEGAMGDPGEEE